MMIIRWFLITIKELVQYILLDLSMEEHNKFHLPKQFNEDCYNHVIYAFQGERNISVVIHVKDFNAQRDEVYTQQNEEQ